MTNSNITKEKWRSTTRELLTWSISTLLNLTETTGISLEILKERPEEDTRVFTFKTLTYKKEQQYEFFYLGVTGDISRFGVYQKRMSLTKHDKSVCLKDDQTIARLSHEEAGCYNNVITSFVMANIVWE